jgi:hypothetical protein
MKDQQVNIHLMERLLQWDPLGYGVGSYETEAVDVLQAVHSLSDSKKLARKIQAIYEFSFEELIPLVDCQTMATELLKIADASTCDIE